MSAVQRRDVDSVLVPLVGDRLLLPKVAVADVHSVDAMSFRIEEPAWWLGSLPWQGLEVPVVSFEALAGHDLPARSRRARVVVINSLGVHLDTGLFAVLSQGHPHLATLTEAALTPDNDAPAEAPELSRLRVGNTRAVIPDLEAIELQLSDTMKG